MLSRILTKVNDKKLLDAVRGGKTEKVKKLLANGIDAGAVFDKEGNALLGIAVVRNDIEMAKLLLEDGRVDPNAICKKDWRGGEKPLYHAITNGKVDMVRVLLDHGASPNESTTTKWDLPLFTAVRYNQPEIARLVLEKGADAKVPGMLHHAVQKRYNELVDLLLSHGADPNKLLLDEGRPLISAINNKDTQMVKKLLDHGARPEYLSTAAYFGPIATVKLLIDRGADLNAVGVYDSSTPICSALIGKHIDIYKYLLEKGADPNQLDGAGRNALHYLADKGHTELVRDLLNRGGMDINKEASYDGFTPLHMATWANHSDIVKLLLEKGANPNLNLNFESMTPLHLAARVGKLEIVQLLLAHGADPEVRNSHDERPIDLAKKYGRGVYNWDHYIDRRPYDRIIQLLSPVPAPIPVMGREVLRNAYKDLGVEPTATDAEIRAAYLKLRRALEKKSREGRAASASASRSGSVPSLRSITASYNMLKNHREAYDAAVVKPRRALMAKIRELCFNNDADPVTMKNFEEMSIEELRRIYVISAHGDKRIEDARSRGHCFEKDTLKAMVRNGVRKNPMTREPLRPALLAELQAASRGGRGKLKKRKGI